MQKSDHPTNKKNVFSNFVYQTNHRFRKGFKSSSFVESNKRARPIQDTSTQTTFGSSTTVKLGAITPRKVDIFRESCTQTSKTTIGRSPSADRLSPDSLSPRYDGRRYCGDGVPKKIEVSRKKNDVLQYVNKYEECQHSEHFHQFNDGPLRSGNALTKAYLEKNRCKFGRNISGQPQDKLKSLSYIDGNTSSIPKKSPKPSLSTRTKPQIHHNNNNNQPTSINHFCQTSTNNIITIPGIGDDSHSRRSVSFMSPTISSESKDQSIEINCIKKLIAPTKKGRSPSPKTYIATSDKKKVPYIDKSEMTVMMDRDIAGEDDEEVVKLSLKSSLNEMSSNASTLSMECALSQAINRLRDSDWNTSLRGLAEVVEICRILDTDVVFSHMTVINQRLIELIKSPRSHVSRTSCQAIGHLFEYVKDTRRPEFDELVDSLLCKCADSNKFIRHDANLALDCMVTHIPTFHAVRAICSKGPDHKNPLVRVAASRLLVCAVVIAGAQNILHPQNNEFTRKRIVLNMSKFLNDRDAEVRKYGERVYKMLCKDRIFDLYLNRYLERDVIIKMKKLIRLDNGRKF